MNAIEAPANVHPMMMFLSPGETCFYSNQQCLQQLGLDHDSLSRKPLLDLIHPDDRPNVARLIAREDKNVYARVVNTKGEWVKYSWKIRSLGDQHYLLGIGFTEGEYGIDWDHEEEDSSQSTLKVTLAMMTRIVESKNPGMRCSILLLDENQEFVSVSAGPSFPDEYNQAIEGLVIGPHLGSCGTAAFWNIPVIVENIYEDPLWENLRDAARIAGVHSCWSHPITTINGSVLGAMALYSNAPKLPEKHQMDSLEIAARMVGLAIERDMLENQLRKTAKLEALGVLAGGIAHDFNNLLTAILGNTELVMLQLDEGAEARQMLNEVAAASMKATELCQQMLAYAGRSNFSKELFDCNAEILELGELLKVVISKKVNIHYHLNAHPLGVMGDRSQLRQVIMNLITNASEAIGNDEGDIFIKTGVRYFSSEVLSKIIPDWSLDQGEYVVIDVSDTGKGMAEVTKAKIFDPFYTTKTTGRGLGLAAVQGIIQGHNGAITLESTEGEGATFCILLPYTKFSVTRKKEEQVEETEMIKAGILVIDDEKQVREVLAQILEKAGYEVFQASEGVTGLALYKQEKDNIDCVLVDFSMPGMDGLDVLNELRKINATIRVILSSGYAEQQLSSDLKDAGFSCVIQKPVSISVLLGKVAEVLK